MHSERIGARGVLFTFADEISVYLINGASKLFLCDTHLGPNSMAQVKEYVAAQGWGEKAWVVFNSHSDWDHIWGNCAFPKATIIGHQACRARMQERGEFDLAHIRRELRKGEVTIRLPDLTFDGRLAFADEEVEFIYAPGHTVCSAVCIDHQDGVAFVGDLLESPLPYTLDHDLDAYIGSLQMLKRLPVGTYVTVHSGVVEQELIDQTISYLEKLRDDQAVEIGGARIQGMHAFNRNNVVLLHHEQQVRARLGDRFDFASHMEEMARLLGAEHPGMIGRRLRITDHDELKQILAGHFAKM